MEKSILLELPEPPSYLDKNAKEEYKRAGNLLIENGTLTLMDITPLITYAKMTSEIVDLEKFVKKSGNTYAYKSKTGYENIIIRPEVNQLQKLRTLQLAYVKELGLTPASRKRIARNAEKALKLTGEDDALLKLIE